VWEQSCGDRVDGINQGIGWRTYVVDNLQRIAAVHRAQGDLAEARRKEEEALAILDRIGERLWVPVGRLALAWQSIEEGHPIEAEQIAREPLTSSRRSGTLTKKPWPAVLLLAPSSTKARSRKRNKPRTAPPLWPRKARLNPYACR
jgi:hypothetical protein